jgi:quercetin dioxygenase-like cupin family protein
MMAIRRRSVVIAVALAALTGGYMGHTANATTESPATDAQVRAVFNHTLPPMDGANLKVSVVEVNYPPGGISHEHSHPCPVFGYVLEGALRTQVKGEPEAIYTAGQTFYEPPNGVHRVSANASDKQPARFLAYFVCDRETPLSVPVSKRSNKP